MNKIEYAMNRIQEDIEELELVIQRVSNEQLIVKYKYTLEVLKNILKDIEKDSD